MGMHAIRRGLQTVSVRIVTMNLYAEALGSSPAGYNGASRPESERGRPDAAQTCPCGFYDPRGWCESLALALCSVSRPLLQRTQACRRQNRGGRRLS